MELLCNFFRTVFYDNGAEKPQTGRNRKAFRQGKIINTQTNEENF